ncbi:hypothetical protein [Gottschalkia acidurici]|uniref:hypothetical protein n=1 Tax=Clostridium acidurici TaxID=1556 RepID=UPI0002E631ED|nr:hypothetical protein [Gottschalkia acidurici]
MSIRPIDLKIIVPKTQEISRIEQNNQDKQKFLLQDQISEQNKKFEHELKKVNDSEKTEKSKINNNDENEEKGKRENKGKKDRKAKASQDEEKAKNTTLGANIDIKI